MSFISPLPDELNKDQAELYRAITSGKRTSGTQYFPLADDDGRLYGPFGLMLLQPGIGAALQELGSAIRFQGRLTSRQREIAILAVGAVTRSSFEVWAHTPVALGVGLSPTEVSALLDGSFSSEDEGDDVCFRLTHSLLSGHQPPSALRDEAKRILGSALLYELTVLVGYYFTLARTMSVFGVAAPDAPTA